MQRPAPRQDGAQPHASPSSFLQGQKVVMWAGKKLCCAIISFPQDDMQKALGAGVRTWPKAQG